MYPVYYIPSGDTLPILFDTFDGGTGASITLTGLAVTDVEIYKDGSTTQRASDAGITLLDTDGIDFDGITGIHGFSIDTSDDTDSGFYAVGSWYHVIVSSITVDGQTVNFIAAAFRITAAENAAGVPDVHVVSLEDGAITAAAIANGAIDAATFAADVDAEILSYLVDDATRIDASALNTATGTTVPAIKSKTDNLPSDPADQSLIIAATDTIASAIGTVDTVVDAIKAKTDSLTFTKAGEVDANVQSINGVTITGDGQTGTEFGV